MLIREFLNGLFPLTLAQNQLVILKEQLTNESLLKNWENISKSVSNRLEILNNVLTQYIPDQIRKEAIKKVQNVFIDLVDRPRELESVEIVHDFSARDSLHLQKWIDEALHEVTYTKKSLNDQLSELDTELSNISLQIERAPEEESLQADNEAIKMLNKLLIELTVQRNTHIEFAKRHTWRAIELVRKMKKLEESRSKLVSESAGNKLAISTRNLLADFAIEITKRKIKKLEDEFANSFSRLARKADAIVSASIDPFTFEVHLLDKSGKSIRKQDLSAGEKQIYAVAMLEALARTSGRKLPIIIDTPLGRLDSHHRSSLINNYFPNASHQVIVLSTDTEVDQAFYNDLSKHVSHSYQISYDDREKSSFIKEGYFWSTSSEQVRVNNAS